MRRKKSYCLRILALWFLSLVGISEASGTYMPLILRPPDPCTLSTGEATRLGARTSYTFNQILSCLNTPDLVSQFTHNNITYNTAFAQQACAALGGVNCYFPAWIIYQHGADVCKGFTILRSYLLEKNGWDDYMIGLSIENSMVGHNVCGVNITGKILVLDNGWIEGFFIHLRISPNTTSPKV